jgi:hypothetical protein
VCEGLVIGAESGACFAHRELAGSAARDQVLDPQVDVGLHLLAHVGFDGGGPAPQQAGE